VTRTVPARPTDGEGPRRSSAERPSRDRCLDIVQAETTTSPLEVESKATAWVSLWRFASPSLIRPGRWWHES
jgi:hypothetical protein